MKINTHQAHHETVMYERVWGGMMIKESQFTPYVKCGAALILFIELGEGNKGVFALNKS